VVDKPAAHLFNLQLSVFELKELEKLEERILTGFHQFVHLKLIELDMRASFS
jgi:hypothetical protein